MLITTYETSQGAKIYRIPVQMFPGFWGFVYLVLSGDLCVLVDTGSGFGDSNQFLEEGFQEVSRLSGREILFKDLTHIFITHGHIDHFGGLPYLQSKSDALVGIHELDRPILSNYEERLAVTERKLKTFLLEAGVSSKALEELMGLYQFSKSLCRSVRVDFTYNQVGMRLGNFKMYHVPGHTAGHVVIQLHDVLFSGDHILEGISPHQAPERLTLSTGLSHYLQSLNDMKSYIQGINLTLGGHKDPLSDLDGRIVAILDLHQKRLSEVLNYLHKPMTTLQLSEELFGHVNGYHKLLAIEEAGAHIEYLYERGLLTIWNIDQISGINEPAPVLYKSLESP